MEIENRISTKKRSVTKQFILGLLVNFSSIAPSMSLGFSAIALPFLKTTLNPSQLSWFASVASLATPFGCFFAGPFADKYGRKKAMLFVNGVSLLGWIVIGSFCYTKSDRFWFILLGRILTGLSTGLCSSPATVYMAEISTPELRGIFTTWSSASFSLGVLVIYILGFLFKEDLGTICFITSILPCIGLILTCFLVPESPSWLVGKNRIEQAKISLSRIFDVEIESPSIFEELTVLLGNKETKKYIITQKRTFVQKFASKMRYLLQPRCFRPMGLILTYFMFQQFSGIFVIIFYAIDIVGNAGITFDPFATIVVIGVVRLFSAILPSFLAKRFGRRPLSIFSGAGMTICLLPLALYIHLKQSGTIVGGSLTFLPLVCLLFYFITSSIGFLPLPFALAAELFPSKIRGTAAGLSSGVGYFFNFVAVKVYPDMLVYLGRAGTFGFYGFMALAGTVFVIFLLPETKGKSFREIEEYFGGKNVAQRQEEGEERALNELA
ncbi:unnamed protein product [Phyllotreta striolata]|uniref:Major facilitator superfamily (MFS) profile domain-containing protein n=1 Tax=Phyllotreta striolata TaxID=444603 RepID=A0A9P0DWZ1_PHYSR|nr:unnamed protein product [Phyllotreta striolata]